MFVLELTDAACEPDGTLTWRPMRASLNGARRSFDLVYTTHLGGRVAQFVHAIQSRSSPPSGAVEDSLSHGSRNGARCHRGRERAERSGRSPALRCSPKRVSRGCDSLRTASSRGWRWGRALLWRHTG